MSHELAKSAEILLYSHEGSKAYIDVYFRDETFWLTQAGMADLFDVNTPAISKHLKNIFFENELEEKLVISKMETTTQHGAMAGKTQRRVVNFYNLDAIIAVGYRVNSKKATRFRQWATKTLREYIQKGFVLNDELMKNGRAAGLNQVSEVKREWFEDAETREMFFLRLALVSAEAN